LIRYRHIDNAPNINDVDNSPGTAPYSNPSGPSVEMIRQYARWRGADARHRS
jgi:hypothetical protein